MTFKLRPTGTKLLPVEGQGRREYSRQRKEHKQDPDLCGRMKDQCAWGDVSKGDGGDGRGWEAAGVGPFQASWAPAESWCNSECAGVPSTVSVRRNDGKWMEGAAVETRDRPRTDVGR